MPSFAHARCVDHLCSPVMMAERNSAPPAASDLATPRTWDGAGSAVRHTKEKGAAEHSRVQYVCGMPEILSSEYSCYTCRHFSLSQCSRDLLCEL